LQHVPWHIISFRGRPGYTTYRYLKIYGNARDFYTFDGGTGLDGLKEGRGRSLVYYFEKKRNTVNGERNKDGSRRKAQGPRE
jgi:hypothetical protein